MGRFIPPHAPRATFSATVLPMGEQVSDEATGRIYIGDGVTPGGVVQRSGPRILSETGTLTPAATAKTTLETALTAAAAGGVLVVDQPLNIGTARAINPGATLVGEKPVYYSPAAGGGARVQNLPGREPARLAWGQENLVRWLDRITTRVACTVRICGDSNMEGHLGQDLAARLGGLHNVTVTNSAVGGTNIEDWRAGTGVFSSNSKALSNIVAAAPDLIVLGYGGTNESLSGRTPTQFLTSLDAALATIRATLTVGSTSVLVLTSNAMNATTGTGDYDPDERYNSEVRAGMRELASKYDCAFFDRNALFPSAFADFAAGSSQNLWLDSARVHTTALSRSVLLALLYEFLVPRGTMTTDPSMMIADRAVADLPAVYPKGVSIARMTDGPANGFALTFNSSNTGGTFPFQIVFSLGGLGAACSFRTATTTNVWSNFCAFGDHPLAENAFSTSSLITSFPFGRSVMRVSTSFPLNGFVETFREPLNGGNGFQILWSAAADVPPQIRTYYSSAWRQWRSLGDQVPGLNANGDAAATLTVGTSKPVQTWATTLTADRAVTLATTSAWEGAAFRIARPAGGAFNLNVGTGPLKALPASSWCDVTYDGSAWVLTGYGGL